MDTRGFVVPPGGGSVLSMASGRSAALKLLGRDTGDSVMLFEETAPVEHRHDLPPSPCQRRGGLGPQRRNHLQNRR
jgi:hypothetical protein